jgi:hypothetical protein
VFVGKVVGVLDTILVGDEDVITTLVVFLVFLVGAAIGVVALNLVAVGTGMVAFVDVGVTAGEFCPFAVLMLYDTIININIDMKLGCEDR